ncbi:LOW QUALITY PROTEIN: von Willebrand factor A domain-containing protein 7 [Glossophaga mutica]
MNTGSLLSLGSTSHCASHLGPSVLLLLLQLLPPSSAFPNIWSLLAAPGSITQDLPEETALNVLQLFLEQLSRAWPLLHLEDFFGRTLLTNDVSYFGPGSSSWQFQAASGEVSYASAAQDFLPTFRNDPDLDFHAEQLGQGTRLGALQETLVVARALGHTACQHLGAALHALQDFYSHSNAELGQQQPHPYLLWPRQELVSLTQVGDLTCSDCEGLSCPRDLLCWILLTSGYFGTHPSKSSKCSYRGHLDQSSSQLPQRGINKDRPALGFSPSHMLYLQAAKLALLASIQAFSLLRCLGHRTFSKLLDITPASSLSFVLDTMGTMGKEVNAAKIQTHHIVEQQQGGPTEPVHYVLGPFHDPGFGLVFTTSDPDRFWQLSEIQALAGGDEPEMCLSVLELALLHTPLPSDIFVFTDASPTDTFLTNRVQFLTRERHCRVIFVVTEDPLWGQGPARCEVLSPLVFEPYDVVALAPEEEAIFTKDQHILDVAAVVEDSMADLVSLPEPPAVVLGRPVFSVDGLLQRVAVWIHGEASSFIRNRAGVSQGQEEVGSLGHTCCSGKFWMVTMNDPMTRTWEIQVTAKGTPQVRVQAQTFLDFGILMENGPHPGLYPLTQPVAGTSTQQLVEVTGLDSRGHPSHSLPHISHVILRWVRGAELGQVPLEGREARERGLVTASLPPTLLATPKSFLELTGQDGGGASCTRLPHQPGNVVWALWEQGASPQTRPPALRIASFFGPQDLDIGASVNSSFALTSNLST